MKKNTSTTESLNKIPADLQVFYKKIVTEYGELNEYTQSFSRGEGEQQAMNDTILSPAQAFKRIGEIAPYYDAWLQLEKRLKENTEVAEMVAIEEDSEMLAELQEELGSIEKDIQSQIESLKTLAQGEKESGGVVIEIRAGTGGAEAGLFGRDLMKAYRLFCENEGWSWRLETWQENELEGLRVAVCTIDHPQAQRMLLGEAGVHRVQRVPETESSGRIHTSTVSVAVFPMLGQQEEVILDKKDLRVDTYRASGAGGQHVNKTDSAVRITHLPTKISAECQQERSQHQNKARAMILLQARIKQLQAEHAQSEEEQDRRNMIGGATRAEKIRTYNFMQLRVTDHRVGKSWFNLEKVMNGEVQDILQTIAEWRESEMIAAKSI